MRLCPLASGSSGNSIYIGSDTTHLLIDAGISGKKIEEGLNGIDITARDIDAILVTHEHADHIKCLGVMARRYGIPIYATAGTIDYIKNTCCAGKVDYSLFREIKVGERFAVGDILLEPVSVSHDATDPVSYLARTGNKFAAVVTDLGTYDTNLLEKLRGFDVLLLEANHDVRMLQSGIYPYQLKKRILSDKGHLSNEACGRLLTEALHDHAKKIILGHLSKENNYPRLAYEAVKAEITLGDCPYKGTDFPIEVARRDEASELTQW